MKEEEEEEEEGMGGRGGEMLKISRIFFIWKISMKLFIVVLMHHIIDTLEFIAMFPPIQQSCLPMFNSDQCNKVRRKGRTRKELDVEEGVAIFNSNEFFRRNNLFRLFTKR